MSKAVRDRYASMAELATALTGFLQSPSASPTPAVLSSSPASPSPTSGERPEPAGSNSLVGQFLAQLAGDQVSPMPIPTPEPVVLRERLPVRRRPRRALIVTAATLCVILLFPMVYVATENGHIKNTAEHRGTPSKSTAIKIRPYWFEKEKSANTKIVAEEKALEKEKPANAEKVTELDPWPEVIAPAGQKPLVQEGNTSSVPEPDSETPTVGFQRLFNGKDLAGWKPHPKQLGNWRVENGVLIGSGPSVSHLYTNRGDYTDFRLIVVARINHGGGSGVFFRSGNSPRWPGNDPRFPLGYEADINSTDKTPHRTGSLYVNPPGGVRASVTESHHLANAWFKMEVIANGNHFTIKVNEKVTAEYADDQRRSDGGHIALQQLDPQTTVEFRKIEIKELNGAANGTVGLQADPAQKKVGGKPAAHAAVRSKHAQKGAAKTSLPLTRQVQVREFNGPQEVFPNPPHGRSDGVYFVDAPGGSFYHWDICDIPSNSTCEVVARVLSEHPARKAECFVSVSSKPARRGFLIKINGRGELFLEPFPHEKSVQTNPRFGPFTHAAIKPGNEFNKLLLIMGVRKVVILVNGVQVCAPLRFDYDVTPSVLRFGAAGPGNKRAEFDRVEIREIVQPERTPGH